MQSEFIVALAIAIPLILFPAAFVWYLNVGGIYAAIKEAREKRAARKERIRAMAEQPIAATAVRAQSANNELVKTRR